MSGKRLAAAFLSLSLARTLGAQSTPMVSAPISGVTYTVTADKPALESRRLGVVMSFDVGDSASVLLSLPAWTPGAYEISNFARWVSSFRPEEGGIELRWDKLDYDTWRLHPTRAGRVNVSFTYEADTLDNAMAWTRPDFALFNGTNVFMYPEGRALDFASTVAVKTEAEFRVTTGLASAGARGSFRATNYHELVDMPVFVGRFDLDSTFISGKAVRLATYPVGSVAGQARATTWEQLKRVIPIEVRVFGEAPWNNYTVMQIADSTTQGFSGLEHTNSHVDIVTSQGLGADFLPSLYAHEIFHSWNVKRLRPADMMPYHYDRPQPTTWLWVSEGITDYYADLAEVRGGVVDAAGFYALTAAKIDEIAHTVPFSLEDASLNTWIHPRDGTGYSYYPKGSLAGLMLDIIVRDASNNKSSLDGVMRELYETTYKKGRGFTPGDFWGAVGRAAGGRSMDDFERKYVAGRDAYPWPAMLKTAGMRMMPDSTPRIGVSSGVDPAGTVRVLDLEAGGAAALAGVKVGDEMLKVGDIAVNDVNFGAKFRLEYAGRPAGSPLPLTVKRGIETLTLRGALAYASSPPKLADDPAATSKALRIRNGILRGLVDR
jgi:predicted metalloprotease with PDZ domain